MGKPARRQPSHHTLNNFLQQSTHVRKITAPRPVRTDYDLLKSKFDKPAIALLVEFA